MFSKIVLAAEKFNLNSQSTNIGDFKSIVGKAIDFFLFGFIPFIIALALVVFLWGTAKYIFNSGDDAQRKSGIELMVYGLIGLFVMVSVWGLVGLLTTMFSIEIGGANVFIPLLPEK